MSQSGEGSPRAPSTTDPRTPPTTLPVHPFLPTRGPAPQIGRPRGRRRPPPRPTPRLQASHRPSPPQRNPPARGAASSSGCVSPPCPTYPRARCPSFPPTPRRSPALGTRRWPRRPTPPTPRPGSERVAPPPSASRVPRVGWTPPCTDEDGGRVRGGDVAPPGEVGAGDTRPGLEGRGTRVASSGARGKGPTAPRGAAAWAVRLNPGAARRCGYAARARHRAASSGAATSGAVRQRRSLSS